jgi:hypothetical protein
MYTVLFVREDRYQWLSMELAAPQLLLQRLHQCRLVLIASSIANR